VSRLVATIFSLALLVALFAVLAASPASATQPAGLKIGVFLPDPQLPDEQLPDITDIHSFESQIGRQADVFLWYESIGENFYADNFRPMAEEGRIIQLAWEPHDFSLPATNQPAYRLERITAGYLDNNIRRWARELRDFGYTVYFRPMCEMNGDWVTWGGTVNGNTPDDYVPAWRHVHDIFVQEGATNVKWVWSPNRDGDVASALNTFNTYYPGDAYVDFVGINGYNWGHLYNTPEWTSEWQPIDVVFGPSYDAFTSRTNKPVVIAETASTEVGGDKAAWITDAFAKLPVRFPKIELITWFNINKETDWRIDSSAASLAAFRAAVQGPDATPPSVDLTAPVAGAALTGDAALTASASDNVGVNKVEFFLGDTLLGTDTTAPFSQNLATVAYPDGSYEVSAKAYDSAGNVTTASAPVSFSNPSGRAYFFGVYDNVNMRSWIIIGNPGLTAQTADVYVGGVLRGTYTIEPQQRATPQFAGLASGPVKVVSRTGGDLLVSERNVYNNTFSELPAMSQDQLASEQLLSWYDEASPGMKNYVVIGNQGSQTAQVELFIGGELKGSYSLDPGRQAMPEFPGVMNGPVRVVSTNGQPLLVSSRVFYNGTFNEIAGKAASSLASEYNFTWYDEVSPGMRTWVIVGNQGSETAQVGIYIAGTLMGLYEVPAGGRITPDYNGTMNGPVRVISTNGQPLIVGERSTYRGSFEEVPGASDASLTSEQWFAWYDDVSAGMKTWVLVGNQSQTTAEVDVKIGGTLVGHYSIPAGGRVTPLYPGQMNGPVQVVSTEGTPQLVVSQRTTFYNSFDELPGMHLT